MVSLRHKINEQNRVPRSGAAEVFSRYQPGQTVSCTSKCLEPPGTCPWSPVHELRSGSRRMNSHRDKMSYLPLSLHAPKSLCALQALGVALGQELIKTSHWNSTAFWGFLVLHKASKIHGGGHRCGSGIYRVTRGDGWVIRIIRWIS